ncbi:isoprenylcysteine carboxylmethyltransferase family protein [Skermania sp. ID1734]|uniref:methyltransferase family protein n=1 Tax=Skermania sp. ID1734 TaxID=2597516 RepID=UPI00163D6610|nr:isoprenylcysteine carboxylmethyltransferase family protein [Skermania sp. ID1734]
MWVITALAEIGILAWAGFEFVLRRRSDSETGSWTDSGSDHGSTRILVLSFLGCVAIASLAAVFNVAQIGVVWRIIALAGLVAGLALRAWGMAVLDRQYTRTVRSIQDHQLVTAGPYSVIRHPGYAGSIVVWAAYAFALGSWLAGIVVFAVLMAAYGYRVRTEERLLTGVFGERYRAYQRRTSRLVPFVY